MSLFLGFCFDTIDFADLKWYHYGMRNTFLINSYGHKLKVFRIGSTAKIMADGKAEKNETGVVHTHFTYEVFFVTEGSLTLVTEKGESVFEESAVIIPPRIGHYSIPSHKRSYCLLLSFEKEDTPFEIAIKNKITALPLSSDAVFYIRRGSERLDEGTPDGEKDAELLITLLFNSIIKELLPSVVCDGASQSSQRHINAIEAIVNERLREGVSLSEIASGVYLSKRQVSRIISKEYGCSLPELMNGKRLKAAEILLKTTSLSVSKIAEEVGISSEGYFYTLFKAKYGITPLQYRKRRE